MQTLTITVGLPGSGKSTEVARRQPRYEVGPLVISPDQIRRQVVGDQDDQDHNAEVFALAHELTRAALAAGWDVTFDATNLHPDHRAPLAEIAREVGARPLALRFPAVAVAFRRNADRTEHQVPDEAMAEMAVAFEAHCSPDQLSYVEGWDVVDVDTGKPGVTSYAPYMPAWRA